MKKLVKKSIEAVAFPPRGSASDSDTRHGIIPFGRQDRSIYNFRDGWRIEFEGKPKVTYNTSTGKISTYLSFYVRKIEKIEWPTESTVASFYGYTPEETEELIHAFEAMSDEELEAAVRENMRVRSQNQ